MAARTGVRSPGSGRARAELFYKVAAYQRAAWIRRLPLEGPVRGRAYDDHAFSPAPPMFPDEQVVTTVFCATCQRIEEFRWHQAPADVPRGDVRPA